jgi:hypothetical protein
MIHQHDLPVPPGLIEEILKLKQTTRSVRNSNRGGWHSPASYRVEPQWQSWLQDLERLVGYKIYNYWFNVNGPGHSNTWHTHGTRFPAVAVWYLQTPPSSGRLLIRQAEGILAIDPRPGLIVQHPSGIDHCVEENLSTELRISVAVNFIG